jgi:hypothetical protein
MRLRFERTGGIANIPLGAELDSAEMPAERAEALKGLVERVRPFDQPADAHGPVVMADQFHYEVTIEGAAGKHSIPTSDDKASADLKLLFDYLGAEAVRKLRNRQPAKKGSRLVYSTATVAASRSGNSAACTRVK